MIRSLRQSCKFGISGLFICCTLIFSNLAVQAQADPGSEIIRLVNELRASHGVPPYQVDPILMSVAQAQASWSAANNHIGHDGPGGSSPNDRAQAAGYGGGSRSFATENVAHGTASLNTPDLVFSMWQMDWGHLNAMISADYEHIGVGYAEAGDYSWYVMMVGWVDEGSPSMYTAEPGLSEESLVYIPFVVSEPDKNGAIYHEVQAGQTAWTIAANYEIGLAELLALNNLTENSILQPGDVLLIRPPEIPTGTPPTFSTKSETAIPTNVSSPSATATLKALPNPQSTEASRRTGGLLIAGAGLLILVGIGIAYALSEKRSREGSSGH